MIDQKTNSRFLSLRPNIWIILLMLVGSQVIHVWGQNTIFGTYINNSNQQFLNKVDPETCDLITVGELTRTNGTSIFFPDIAITPLKQLLGIRSDSLFTIDSSTAEVTFFLKLSNPFFLTGFTVAPDGTTAYGLGTALNSIDLNTGIITNLGGLPESCGGDATFYNGELFYTSVFGLYKVNISNPPASQLISNDVQFSYALSPNPDGCGFLYSGNTNGLQNFDLTTNGVSAVCTGDSFNSGGYASINEFASFPQCISLDLDADNSTGAPNPDRDTTLVFCEFTESLIVPGDLLFTFSGIIDSMHIIGVSGFSADEFLSCPALPFLTISGNNSTFLSFTGSAFVDSYSEAILNTLYTNNESPLIEDFNEIMVRVFPQNVSPLEAMVTIEASLPDDLDDIVWDVTGLCPSDSVTLDATDPNIVGYQWSTGDTVPAIVVFDSDEYQVTLTDQSGCERRAIAPVVDLPTVEVLLSLNNIIGCNESVINLVIEVDGSSQVDVTIVDTINNRAYNFTDLIPGSTTVPAPAQDSARFFIQSVTSDDACAIWDPDVFTYFINGQDYLEISNQFLCAGDSLWFYDQYIFDPGSYAINLFTSLGCDSIIQWEVFDVPSYSTTTTWTTCDINEADTNINIYSTSFGCDSTVINIITFVPSDTTLFSGTTCNVADTGISIVQLVGSDGCDSIIISNFSFAESDTTIINSTTCAVQDSGQSIVYNVNQFGCDSIVISNRLFVESDTTILSFTTCIAQDSGQVIDYMSNSVGCDSVIISNYVYALSDTTIIDLTTCNVLDTARVINNYVNQEGCDSIVVTTYDYIDTDTTLVQLYSCTVFDTGQVVNGYINAAGCDSVVITQTDYQPLDTFYRESISCTSADTGLNITRVFDGVFCDSIIVERILLLTIDTTFLSSETCVLADTGTATTVLSSQDGCDSVVVESFVFRTDTTLLFDIACNPADTGIFVSVLASTGGCDSMLFTLISLGRVDSIIIERSSCIAQDTGVYSMMLTNEFGCDSVVIDQVSFVESDTTWLFDASCFPLDTGIFVNNFINRQGCDSIVIEDIALLRGDSTIITSTICGLVDTTISVVVFDNRFGCDSVVVEQLITLPGSDTTYIRAYTCQPADTFTEINYLLNVYDCDSIVVNTVQLEDCQQAIYIPNAFSPNDDGINEYFGLFSDNIVEISSYQIYNRWGGLVYSRSDFRSDEKEYYWGGLINEKLAQEGVYIYQIELTDESTYAGEVLLVR